MGGGKRIIVDNGFDQWLSQFSKELGMSKKKTTQKIPEILNAQSMVIQRNHKKKEMKDVNEEWDHSKFRF